MELYTSKDGKITIKESHTGALFTVGTAGVNLLENFDFLSRDEVRALGEYYTAERDKELGRWRDPEHTNLVIYPTCLGVNWIHVFDEAAGKWETFERGLTFDTTDPEEYPARDAAKRFFVSNPEKKPWHDAVPGEYWEIQYDGLWVRATVYAKGVKRFVLDNGLLEPGNVEVKDTRITRANRLYPVGE